MNSDSEKSEPQTSDWEYYYSEKSGENHELRLLYKRKTGRIRSDPHWVPVKVIVLPCASGLCTGWSDSRISSIELESLERVSEKQAALLLFEC